MLYPKLKSTVDISKWREGYLLRSLDKNSGQVFISVGEHRLVEMMTGEHSIDDLERSSAFQDPLAITKLLRSLWNRDMLEHSEEVQQMLFPEQQQFVVAQKRRWDLIGTDIVHMSMTMPLPLRNKWMHHQGIVYLAAALLMSIGYLFFAGHLNIPSSPFSFNGDWIAGSLFSYFGASLFLSVKALYQGQILSSYGDQVTFKVGHQFGIVHLSVNANPIFHASTDDQRWYSLHGLSILILCAMVCVFLSASFPDMPWMNAALTALLLFFWELCPFYPTDGARILETFTVHKQRFRTADYIRQELVRAAVHNAEKQGQRAFQTLSIIWFVWLFGALELLRIFLLPSILPMQISIFQSTSLVSQLLIGIPLGLSLFYLTYAAYRCLEFGVHLLMQIRKHKKIEYVSIRPKPFDSELSDLLVNGELFSSEELVEKINNSENRKYLADSTILEAGTESNKLWVLQEGSVCISLPKPEGGHQRIHHIKAPAILSLSALEWRAVPHDIIAEEECRVVLISPPTEIGTAFATRLNQIRGHEYFSQMPSFTLLHLALNSRIQGMQQDDQVIQKGDEADSIYVIRSGMCLVEAEGGVSLEKDGIFGEMGFLSKQPRNANVHCVKQGYLLRIPATALTYCIQVSSALSQELEGLAQRRQA